MLKRAQGCEKKATREGYGEALLELGERDESIIVLDADLSGATKTAKFAKAFPKRFFNAGIAEANMMGTAAGLSLAGYTVFASSFAMFAAGRAFEQVRNSIAYPQLNVKIGASHAGLSVGEDGASHQCCEDIALMRSIPGMTIFCPADATEARGAVFAAAKLKGPVYLRLGRLALPLLFDEASYTFEPYKAEELVHGNDIAIFATGLMVHEALDAAEMLSNDGISARVINVHTIKPLDSEGILKAAGECGCALSCEEHSIIGGLGEAVSALLCENSPCPLIRVGVRDEFGRSGPAKALLKLYGLDAEHIVSAAKKAIAMKKI